MSETNVETPLLDNDEDSHDSNEKIHWEDVNSDNESDDSLINDDIFPEFDIPDLPEFNIPDLPDLPDLNNKPNIEQIIKDFINDLQNTFPEIETLFLSHS